MKTLIMATSLAILLASGVVQAKVDEKLARKQIVEAAQQYGRSSGMKSKQLSKALRNIRGMSSAELKQTIKEIQDKGIRIGERSAGVKNKLAAAFKSYSDRNNNAHSGFRNGSSSTTGRSYNSNTFGSGKSGNGTTNSLQGSMTRGVNKGTRTGQQSGFGSDLWDWATKTPEQAYADKQKKGRTGYGSRNWPANCMNTGCKEMPNPNASTGSGNSVLDREREQAKIDAKQGRFGFKRGQKGSSGMTIDPKTGKMVMKQNGMAPTKLEKQGGKIRTKKTVELTEEQKIQLEIKAKGGKVKQ